MFYHCSNCHTVYYLIYDSNGSKPFCCARRVRGAKLIPITITADTDEWSECGGEVTGMKTTISLDSTS